MRLEVELDACVIPANHNVFKLSPGKTYRFYDIVRERKVAFLDIKGLDQLPDNPKNWGKDCVLRAIAGDRWERELDSRKRGNKPHGSPKISKIDKRNYTFLDELIWQAKKGDLLVVPVQGYLRDVLIGEFITEPGQIVKIPIEDDHGFHTYIGRQVRWLSAVEKRFFSADMLKIMHNPTAIFVMKRSLREEVYKHAYRNFVFDGDYVASFETTKSKFTAADSAVISVWFNGFDFLWTSKSLDPNMSFAEMGLTKIASGQAAEIQININSPGKYILRSTDPFPLAIMAMLALSSCSAEAVVNEGVAVKMKKVGGATVDCQHEIESSINQMATTLGTDRLEEACRLGARAQSEATLKTDSTLN